MDFESEAFGSDADARRKAVVHNVEGRGKEGLIDVLEKILEHIHALENP